MKISSQGLRYNDTLLLERVRLADWLPSPVPELSFLPTPYKGLNPAGEKKSP